MKKSFECPMCHKELEAETEWGGQETECPYCSSTINIPHFAAMEQKTEKPSRKPKVSSQRKFSFFKLCYALLVIAQTAILAGILFILIKSGENVDKLGKTSDVIGEKIDKLCNSINTNIDKINKSCNSLNTNIKSLACGNNKTEKKELATEDTDPYAKLKKQYNLEDRHIEFIKKQPAPAFLETTMPSENVKVMMLVSLGSEFLIGGYSNKQSYYHCIKVCSPKAEKSWGYGYIERDSEDGKKLFNKLKDGDWHFAEIEIRYSDNSYDYISRHKFGHIFDITKVIDVR